MLTVPITSKSPKKALSVECWLSAFKKNWMNVECWMFPTFTSGYFFADEWWMWALVFNIHSQINIHPAKYPRIMKIFGHILLKSENMPVKPNIFCTSVREISQLSTIDEQKWHFFLILHIINQILSSKVLTGWVENTATFRWGTIPIQEVFVNNFLSVRE